MPVAMNIPVNSLISNKNPHQSCIDICSKCAQICNECLNLCLHESDVKSRIDCIRTLQDCAEICTTSACFMSRGSGSIKEICNLCAVICEKCIVECEMHDDEHCKTCANICSQCADECRKVSNM
ncbi:four-helix bundle copper-binding protein [Clostridium sp. 'White wine YQ']|uniref:four-helix bundle copper-binding protein n=1 Tax=Clostridium sp. 'White wine YQ' TaxID=3027474 RepID=UPI002365DE0D|nr:four-helix bundle copper-binding protein [Clostridium sp. 'White wine YQ']MDD7794091.1 four-helix bundle copper-binding protein [Clostridium sp. 'White wine YQ']